MREEQLREDEKDKKRKEEEEGEEMVARRHDAEGRSEREGDGRGGGEERIEKSF